MATQIDTLRQNLLDLLHLLRSLSSSQLQMLVNFDRREESLKPDEVIKMINHLDNSQLESVLKLSLHSTAEIQAQKQLTNDKTINQFDISYIGAIGCVYRIFLLQEMIQNNLTLDQLMKIVEITPYKGFPDQQYQFLMQFQQLLGLLMPSTIASLHEDVNNGEGDELLDLLEDHHEQYLLYQPLKSFLCLDLDEVTLFCEVFPKFRSTQIVQLVRLIQFDPLNILELRQLLSPKGWMGLQTLMETDTEMEEMNSNPFISLTIIDQPSDQTVYKRNLKPFPTVMVTGDERKILSSDECLIVVPMLYRCDTLSPVPKLTGDAPVKIASGNTAKFKKLKIMITSRQLNDTLFCLRFELRKTKIGSRNLDQSETITFIQSNPISVVSHSTLMKKLPTVIQPVINEIIPANGSSSGGNKVVIIGANFVDSPVLRVRFDNIDVIPEFYGSGTLTCTAPQHFPGPVSVSVSNDAKIWSEIPATYIYQGANQDDQTNAMLTSSEYDFSQSNNYHDVLSPSLKYFDSVVKLDQSFFRSMPNHIPPDFNVVDSRGFSLMHYVAVTGDLHLAHFFLMNKANVNHRDVNGNTALHWAVLSGNLSLIPLFVHFGAPLNIQNFFGETPLHLAVASNQLQVVEYLIKCGANLNAINLHSQTPLHYAAVISENLVSLLLKHGANVNALDYEGESPLHFAAREELLPVISTLLSFAAYPNIFNRSKETPFHLATLSSNSHFVFSLVNLQKFDVSAPFEHLSSEDYQLSSSSSSSSAPSLTSSSSPASIFTTALDSFLFKNKAFLSDPLMNTDKLATMLRNCTLSTSSEPLNIHHHDSTVVHSFISV